MKLRFCLTLILLLWAGWARAAFTEFYCNASTGNNTYAGSTEGSPVLTLTGGDWVSGTGVYTKTGAVTGVSVGMFAAVMVDGGTVAARVGRVTAVDANTVTISTTAGSGSLADQTATATIKVGGAWKGPNAAVNFPFGFVTGAQTNAAGDTVRVNFKNNATYSITAAITHTATGPVVFQGYSSTAGDGGKFIIDGGTSGASYALLTLGTKSNLVDAILQNNGATGSASGLVMGSGINVFVYRVVVNNVRGIGVSFGSGMGTFIEVEAYACNQSNTGSMGGFVATAGTFWRCIAHDNAGSNSQGFRMTGAAILRGCIADTNGADGFFTNDNSFVTFMNCDAYNNTGDGLEIANTSGGLFYVENCNFVKNGGYGILGSGGGNKTGFITNCGFGAGTQANTSGTTSAIGSLAESGTVIYASDVTPWTDPANGDFRVSLAAAKNAGRGSFTQTAASYAGTVGYPDIGAAQSAGSNTIDPMSKTIPGL